MQANLFFEYGIKYGNDVMDMAHRAWGRTLEAFAWVKGRYLNGFEFMKFHLIGLLGVSGFPLFYFIWNDLYPQPYENLWLRLFLAGLCGVFLFTSYFPPRIRAYVPLYAYITVVLALPFFFTFMLLKNDANAVWQMSTICAVVYVILIFDTVNMLVAWVAGTVLAVISFALTSDGVAIPQGALTGVPVVLFAFAGGLLFSHGEEITKYKRRMQTVAALGSSIAHEMRTPLLGIKLDAEGMRRKLSRAADGHIQPRDVEVLSTAVDRIERQVVFANTVIDMLLTNVRQEKIDPATFQHHSMAGIVEQALDRYPFKADQKDKITLDLQRDFRFFGSDILMIHVLFNLLKNALRAIAAANRGEISIRLEAGESDNRLIFLDTGTGIAPDVLPHIFDRFFTGSETYSGAGIGLSLSRRVIHGFMGTIACTSEYGKFTEFTISLPVSQGGPEQDARSQY